MSIYKHSYAAVAALLVSAAPAFAQQEGLVNVDVSGNTVQLPIAVAANICDLDVNVLAEQAESGDTVCTIDQETVAANNNAGGASGADQEGLVNVAIQDNTVQLPIAVAANLCDIDVNVLAQQVEDGDTECEIVQGARAENNAGGNGNGNAGGNGNGANAAGDTLEGATDTVNNAADEATETVDEAADEAAETVDETTDAADEAVDEATETVEGATN